MKTISILIVALFLWPLLANAQNSTKVLFQPHSDCSGFINRIDNYIEIVAQQENPITIDDVSATFQSYNGYIGPFAIKGDSGNFYVHPDSIGLIVISIKTNSGIQTQQFYVKNIPAVGYLSGYRANSDKKIGVGEMKAQSGLSAVIVCCGFDAKCKMIGFEIIRITRDGFAQKALNKGERFEESAQKIIRQTESGDIYVFRKIKYSCPGMEAPSTLDDMTFEIQ